MLAMRSGMLRTAKIIKAISGTTASHLSRRLVGSPDLLASFGSFILSVPRRLAASFNHLRS